MLFFEKYPDCVSGTKKHPTALAVGCFFGGPCVLRRENPSAAAKPNGRIAMIALRRCVNPPIPGGMNVRSEHLKISLTCRRTFRFRSPYGPPYEEHNNIDILRKNRVFTRAFAPFWHFGSVTKKSRNADIFRILVGRERMSAKF